MAGLYKRLSKEDLNVRWYEGADPRLAFEVRLKLALGLPAEAQFGRAKVSSVDWTSHTQLGPGTSPVDCMPCAGLLSGCLCCNVMSNT